MHMYTLSMSLSPALSRPHTHSWQRFRLAVMYWSSLPCSVSGAASVLTQCSISSVNLFSAHAYKHIDLLYLYISGFFFFSPPYLLYPSYTFITAPASTQAAGYGGDCANRPNLKAPAPTPTPTPTKRTQVHITRISERKSRTYKY